MRSSKWESPATAIRNLYTFGPPRVSLKAPPPLEWLWGPAGLQPFEPFEAVQEGFLGAIKGKKEGDEYQKQKGFNSAQQNVGQ